MTSPSNNRQRPVFLFEDHKIARASFLVPDNCRKVSTRAFLIFLEQKGWLSQRRKLNAAPCGPDALFPVCGFHRNQGVRLANGFRIRSLRSRCKSCARLETEGVRRHDRHPVFVSIQSVLSRGKQFADRWVCRGSLARRCRISPRVLDGFEESALVARQATC